MRYIFLLLLSLILSFGAQAAVYSVSSVPNVQKADSTKLLSNPDAIISPMAQARIDSLLLDIRRRTSCEVAVVVVDDIDSDNEDEFATELFKEWGIGKGDNNNGVLILMVKNLHAAVIRTGYGVEGVLPDIISGRIIHDFMFPRFREGDFDSGMVEGVKQVHHYLTDPEAAKEVASARRNNFASNDGPDLLSTYFHIALIVAVVILIFVLYIIIRNNSDKQKSDYEKYISTEKYSLPLLMASMLFVGIPILGWLVLWLVRRGWRNKPRKCRRCKAHMKKLNEADDNLYLSYAQDLEEKINSVDYDVWLCPKCGEKDIYSFVNHASSYKECPTCHARTLKLQGARVLHEPTVTRKGVGEKRYVCLNCNHEHGERYSIPKKDPPVPIIVGGSGRGGGGFGSGGFGGGGFGGGLTGGGGASGRW